jgi:hypothetical protein
MFPTLLILGSLLLGQAADSPTSNAEVRQLVRQLDAARLTDREAAETELLRRGPTVLGELPPVNQRTSPETAQRLARIRQKLQQAEASKAGEASTISLHADAISLSKAFAAFQEQSGNRIIDYRSKFSQPITDPVVRADFQKTPFWQALDALLDQASLGVYPFADQRAICIVDRTGSNAAARKGRASYAGPFRFEATRVSAGRDFRDSSGRLLRVTLETAWEPRLSPIYLQQRMADIQATDERGRTLPLADHEAQLEMPIRANQSAVEITLPFQLPPRDIQRIAALKGDLLAVMPGKIETFRFTNLGKSKNPDQRIAEATVTLEDVRKNATGWEVRMRVRFDHAGDALASHRTWIFSNEALLEDGSGKTIRYASYETALQRQNEVGIAYQVPAGDSLEGATFLYRSPCAILSDRFSFDLSDIPLP